MGSIGDDPRDTDTSGRVYAGVAPAERRKERERRLIAAGLELFGTVGYRASTIEAVCKTAGVTARHFYEAFDSREELLRAVVMDLVREAMGAIGAAIADHLNDPDDAVRTGLAAFTHTFLTDPRKGRVLCVETIGVSREFEVFRSQGTAAFVELIATTASAMEGARRVNPDVLRMSCVPIIGAVNELVRSWLLDDDRPGIDLFTDEVTRIILSMTGDFAEFVRKAS